MKRICVFCSSSEEIDPALHKTAFEVGLFLGRNFEEVIYGGSNRGLMGKLAQGVLESKGNLTAVIPQALLYEIFGTKLGAKMVVVETRAERKAKMLELSDALIALPGGWGTMDEIFEMLTLAQSGSHSKPCGFLNANGYYDLLLAFIDSMFKNGAISQEHRSLAISAHIIEDLVKKMDHFKPIR
jgi:uncharacterized protein (TIGR00730 family)